VLLHLHPLPLLLHPSPRLPQQHIQAALVVVVAVAVGEVVVALVVVVATTLEVLEMAVGPAQ